MIKFFKVIISVAALVLMGSHVVHAESYKIKMKSIDSSETHEVLCKKSSDACFSTLKFPFKNEKYSGQIDTAVAIKNGFADIRFKFDGQYLSTADQGWGSFYDRPENFSNSPQIVKLYYPDDAIKGDERYSLPLVVRPPNEFITGVAIYLEPVSDQE